MGLLVSLVLMAGDFSLLETVDGVRVESRPVDGSKFVELRFTTRTRAPVRALCDAAFGSGRPSAAEGKTVQRTVLKESAKERVTYDRREPPVVSKRDYAVRWRRSEGADGSCVISFETANDLAPALEPGWVRITMLRGAWRFVPRGDETDVEYVSYSEPGGDVPAFISEGPRRDLELKVVRELIRVAAR